MIASLVFLTPAGALAGLAVAIPLCALLVAFRREEWARRALRLPAAGKANRFVRAGTLAVVLALLSVAAAQPAIRSQTSLHVRNDAEAIYVIDVSRSMLAARGRGSPTRLARARAAAIELRNALPDVPSGVATLTDRVIPNLLPVPDPAPFSQTVREAVTVASPPPQVTAVRASSLGALAALGTDNFFTPGVDHRLVVVLTDGESSPFDLQATARALQRGPGATTVFVRISSPDEQIFGADGKPELGYRSQPDDQGLATLADATQGSAFGEKSLGEAARFARSSLGAGPTAEHGLTERTRPLAPWLALAALLAFGLRLVLVTGR